MRLLVIGRDGQIARSLREQAGQHADLVINCIGRSEIDLGRSDTIFQTIERYRPDMVINPAAYTAVDKAENDLDLAFTINRDGAGFAARAAARYDIPIMHFSTDYVFDGRKTGLYNEKDLAAPQGVYGQSKLAGELAVANANPRHIILRTAWVYAPYGNNFVNTVLRLSSERDRLRIVDDQIGCPTYAPDIADATISIAKQVCGSHWRAEHAGVTHVAGPTVVSWFAFARKIMRQTEKMGGSSVPVDAIATSEYPTLAARPPNSSLSTERLSSLFGVSLPSMCISLSRCLRRLLPLRLENSF